MKSKVQKSLLDDAKRLEKELETEVNWLKINELFIKLADIPDLDIIEVFESVFKLIHRSFLSERSRLNGSAFLFLKKSVQKLEKCFPQDELIVDACFKLCGRANKIFNKRGEELLILIAEKTYFLRHTKMLKLYSKSLNKKVRKAVYLSIEAHLKNQKDTNRAWQVLESLLHAGEKDPDIESRLVCKRVLSMKSQNIQKTTFSIGQGMQLAETKKETKTNFPFLNRIPVRTNKKQEVAKDANLNSNASTSFKRHNSEIKKIFENTPSFSKIVYTPVKKHAKLHHNQKRKNEKEQPPKDMVEYTPKGLNRYLEQYREEVRRLRISPISDDKDARQSNSRLWNENNKLFTREITNLQGDVVSNKSLLFSSNENIAKHDSTQNTTFKEQFGCDNENGITVDESMKSCVPETIQNDVITDARMTEKNNGITVGSDLSDAEKMNRSESCTSVNYCGVKLADKSHYDFFGGSSLRFENLSKFNLTAQNDVTNKSVINDENVIETNKQVVVSLDKNNDLKITTENSDTNLLEKTNDVMSTHARGLVIPDAWMEQNKEKNSTINENKNNLENRVEIKNYANSEQQDELSNKISTHNQPNSMIDTTIAVSSTQQPEKTDEYDESSKYSFLEKSFNSLEVTEDMEISKKMNNVSNQNNSSNSSLSFEDSCIKNRFDSVFEDNMETKITQIDDFSNIDSILQFNKKTFKRDEEQK